MQESNKVDAGAQTESFEQVSSANQTDQIQVESKMVGSDEPFIESKAKQTMLKSIAGFIRSS